MERSWRRRSCMVPLTVMVVVLLLVVVPQFTLVAKYNKRSWMGAGSTPVRKALQQVIEQQQELYRRTSSSSWRWPDLVPVGDAEDFVITTTTADHTIPPQLNESRPSVVKSVEEDTERFFQAVGSGSPLFVKYGAYRGGSNTFAVVGLGAKALYTFANPQFECYWVPLSAVVQDEKPTLEQALQIKQGRADRMLPDMDNGHIYSVVVVNCTFDEPVGTGSINDQRGGQLVLYASHGDGRGKPPVRFVALTEDSAAYDPSRFDPSAFPYEFAYCGSPLYDELNPARVREWLAHHIRLFGPKSHFFLHDAGGITAEVLAVIQPWQKLGFVTLEDVTLQEDYDGYYHNQFLIINDCLHRTRFMANWTFFFDMDEFIYVPSDSSFHSMMAHDFAGLTMLQLSQVRMADYLCQIPENYATLSTDKWAIEDLVYQDTEYNSEKTASKYAVQGRGVFATGVHRSQVELGHMEGEQEWAPWPNMRYYHYRGILRAPKKRNCYGYLDNSTMPSPKLYGATFKIDNSMAYMGPLAKQFEADQIGHH